MAQLEGVERSFIRAAMKAPYLTREDEHDLAMRWRYQQEQAALDRLTGAHIRLVIALAARFRNYGLSMADMIQEGHVGLLEAAARFEPEREIRFSTYATWWIRASIQDYILKNWSIVRGGTSSTQKALFFNLRRLRQRIALRAGSDTPLDIEAQMASEMRVSKAEISRMEARLAGPDLSLNAPIGADDSGTPSERMDFLVDDAPGPDEIVHAALDGKRRLAWLRAALGELNPREQHILRERRLQDDSETLEALGSKLGISKERVRQIETRALDKLRKRLLELHPHWGALAG